MPPKLVEIGVFGKKKLRLKSIFDEVLVPKI
jgi:hypothetical protein